MTLESDAIMFEVIDPGDADAQHCLREYFAELDRRFEAGFDPDQSIPADLDDMRLPTGLFCVARLDGVAVGCGALKLHGDDPVELKRMWVTPSARGHGLARRLLVELERLASAHGARVVHLETNASLVEAIALYRSAGYREVAAFNDEHYADHWFEKAL